MLAERQQGRNRGRVYGQHFVLVEVGEEAKGADEERKIEGAGEQGEGAKDGSREGTERGSSRQRVDRVQAGRRGACVWCRGLVAGS